MTNSSFAGNRAPAGTGGAIHNGGTNHGVLLDPHRQQRPDRRGCLQRRRLQRSDGPERHDPGRHLPGGNCVGGDNDGGYNIDDAITCGFSANYSQPATNPLLDPRGLQNDGGPTQTIAIQPRSRAVDAIPLSTLGCGTTVTTDQRAVTRPQGPRSDVGAFERAAGLGIGRNRGKKPTKTKKEGAKHG